MTSPCVSLPFPACASNDQFMLNCLARRINSRWCSLKIDTWPGPWMWWHPIGELKKYQFSSHMYIILISLYIDNIHWLHGEHCIGELIRIICPFRCRAFSVFQHCSWLFETIDGGLTFRNQQSVFLEVKLDTSYWTPEPKQCLHLFIFFSAKTRPFDMWWLELSHLRSGTNKANTPETKQGDAVQMSMKHVEILSSWWI